MIRFENVSKKYKNKMVLKNISLEIPPNELVVLIGPSGCGKTTMLKIINRLIRTNGGKIFINNEDINKKDIIKLRRNIGYVIQQTGLFPNMTIKENIETIPLLENQPLEDVEKNTRKLMEMVGLDPDEFLYRYPNQLSGGQQQRIGVARGFANDPDIILMDEPFSALDPITRSVLQDELVLLQNKYKKTIVFVTHDMDEAVKIADKICILNEGEIVQYDTPENILKNPINDYVSDFVGKNRIWSIPELIKAKDIMKTKPVTSLGDITITQCIDKMRKSNVDSIIIVDIDNYVRGIVTAKMIAKAKDRSLLASDIMRQDVFQINENDNILNLIQKVNDLDVSIIPVIMDNKKICGVITGSSLVVTLSQQYLTDEEGEE